MQRINKQAFLNDVFKKPESEVHSFIGALSEGEVFQTKGKPPGEGEARRIVEGQADKVKAPRRLEEKLSGFVRIWCGWHNDDYVWHIEPAAIRRQWKVTIQRVIYAIAKTMNEHIPKKIQVNIWPPAPDFELKTITFKAMGLKHEWRMTEQDIEKITVDLLETLNTLV